MRDSTGQILILSLKIENMVKREVETSMEYQRKKTSCWNVKTRKIMSEKWKMVEGSLDGVWGKREGNKQKQRNGKILCGFKEESLPSVAGARETEREVVKSRGHVMRIFDD